MSVLTFFYISRESKLEIYSAEILQNNPSKLLYLLSSDFIIQNSTLTESDFSEPVYHIEESSTIQLKDVVFIRNKFGSWLLWIRLNFSAIIQTNTMTENNFPFAAYNVIKNSTI